MHFISILALDFLYGFVWKWNFLFGNYSEKMEENNNQFVYYCLKIKKIWNYGKLFEGFNLYKDFIFSFLNSSQFWKLASTIYFFFLFNLFCNANNQRIEIMLYNFEFFLSYSVLSNRTSTWQSSRQRQKTNWNSKYGQKKRRKINLI